MAIFGFICLVLLLIGASVMWFIMLLICAPHSVNRGVPIPVMEVVFFIIGYGWYQLAGWAPFTITFVGNV